MKPMTEKDILDCDYCQGKTTGAEIRGLHVCANHLAIWACKGAKDIGDEKDYGKCVLCDKKAIGYARDFNMRSKQRVIWHFCRSHMKAIGCLNLVPEDVKKMQKLKGETFLTHDDYYDSDGTACQPRK
jgi:hypothetical protein